MLIYIKMMGGGACLLAPPPLLVSVGHDGESCIQRRLGSRSLWLEKSWGCKAPPLISYTGKKLGLKLQYTISCHPPPLFHFCTPPLFSYVRLGHYRDERCVKNRQGGCAQQLEMPMGQLSSAAEEGARRGVQQ